MPLRYKALRSYPKQTAAFDSAARYSFTEGSTKSGKTVKALDWQFRQWINDKRGVEHWWVAPVYAQALIGFARVKRAAYRAIAQGYLTVNNSDRAILNPFGTPWRFRSGLNDDSLYGEDVGSVVLDEASRTSEKAFISCRSTLTATRGPMRVMGNVRGTSNWFWRLCREIEKGEFPDSYEYHKLVSSDAVSAGILHQQEIDDARAVLPEAAFNELYLCEASDAIASFFKVPRLFLPPPQGTPLASVRVWDLAATEPTAEKQDPDFTAGGLFSLYDSGSVIVEDIIRGQMGPLEVTGLIRETAVRDTGVGCHTVVIEEEGGATGKFTVESFKNLLSPYGITVRAARATTAKARRAFNAAVAYNSGLLRVRDPMLPWVLDYTNELHAFGEDPKLYDHDDQVDITAMGYNYLVPPVDRIKMTVLTEDEPVLHES